MTVACRPATMAQADRLLRDEIGYAKLFSITRKMGRGPSMIVVKDCLIERRHCPDSGDESLCLPRKSQALVGKLDLQGCRRVEWRTIDILA
jgi:hypothetical protein